ncbi:MAG TPA: hypothetical protein VL178_13365, partial [Pseudomonas sp.]|nr:hypothetical protein [Pseudomonas sp.]
MPYYMQQPSGELIGPLQIPVAPGHGPMIPTGAIELPELLPEPVPGHAWVCRDGQAVAVSDRRGLVYDTKTGAEQQYTKLGELPEGLTTEPRPGPHHIWLNGWMLDESAQLAALQEAERTWRDSEIASVEWMRDRHRD